jgi:hypothetical protein
VLDADEFARWRSEAGPIPGEAAAAGVVLYGTVPTDP